MEPATMMALIDETPGSGLLRGDRDSLPRIVVASRSDSMPTLQYDVGMAHFKNCRWR